MSDFDFDELHKESMANPAKVWDKFAQEVVWSKQYDTVIDDVAAILPNWYGGGEINMSYNCLDRHVEDGYGDEIAVIYESPVTDTIQKITYRELLESVELFAGVMVQKCGIKKGDRVLFYFPVIPQCLVGMLACTRIGAIYSVVFGGFAPSEIAVRMQHTEPKLVLTCNVAFEPGKVINYKEKIDHAILESNFKPDFCIVYNRPNSVVCDMNNGRDMDWDIVLKDAIPQTFVPVESNHPLFIIYTSGTTGEPKGLVMGTANSIVSDKYMMKYMLNLKPGETWWMFSDFGWITGQTVMTYGPLLLRCPTVLYEGKAVTTPDASQIARIMHRNNVVSFLCSPTVMRTVKDKYSGFDGNIMHENLRAIYLAGEISHADLRQWVSVTFKCPVYDIWGQTELNSVVTSPGLAFGRPINSSTVPMLGFSPRVIDINSLEDLPINNEGVVLLKAPMPPAVALTLYKNHERYLDAYFKKYPGYYDTKDCGKIMPNGSLEIMARTDDVIQMSAIPICGGVIENICLRNPHLINVAVVPLEDDIYGQIPFAFIVKRSACNSGDGEIIKNLMELVNEHLGEFAMFKQMVNVESLPKTKTGKISRKSLSDMLNGRIYSIPSTVENPNVYTQIHGALINAGYKAATLPK